MGPVVVVIIGSLRKPGKIIGEYRSLYHLIFKAIAIISTEKKLFKYFRFRAYI